jgi:PncC family amidohydrolase
MDGSGAIADAASGGSRPPERLLGALLTERPGPTVAAAESCSGGEVAHRITSVPGSSAYFLGSIVAYANDAKHRLLGVPGEVLETKGAVSPECARSMAEGARRAFGADVAIATTGIAGPGGATARKPIGLVYLAVAWPGGAIVDEHRFPGDRAAVVAAAAEAALRLLLRGVERALVD